VICAARTGERFHGWHNRNWTALAGNLHLTCLLSPELPISGVGPAFQLLAAVSTLRTIDDFRDANSPAGIKWINDLLLCESKVGGVLARTQTQGDILTAAVLGIGLNVQAAPELPATPSVPAVGSLQTLLPANEELTTTAVFNSLIGHLAADYQLVTAGNVRQLLDFYRARSLVVGREVILMDDRPDRPVTEIARGRVAAIGDGLELFLDGRREPLREGRLILSD
jgi:BirA family biotin operon repressor/biotin-[acetyl-CoA-carboxylase] ligase